MLCAGSEHEGGGHKLRDVDSRSWKICKEIELPYSILNQWDLSNTLILFCIITVFFGSGGGAQGLAPIKHKVHPLAKPLFKTEPH